MIDKKMGKIWIGDATQNNRTLIAVKYSNFQTLRVFVIDYFIVKIGYG